MTPPNPDDVAECAKWLGAWKRDEKCQYLKDTTAHYAVPGYECPKCGHFFGQKETYSHDIPCPPPSPALRVAIEDKLVSEGCIVSYWPPRKTINKEVVIDNINGDEIWRGPNIYAACADYLRRGK